jgi:hypothetical protein
MELIAGTLLLYGKTLTVTAPLLKVAVAATASATATAVAPISIAVGLGLGVVAVGCYQVKHWMTSYLEPSPEPNLPAPGRVSPIDQLEPRSINVGQTARAHTLMLTPPSEHSGPGLIESKHQDLAREDRIKTLSDQIETLEMSFNALRMQLERARQREVRGQETLHHLQAQMGLFQAHSQRELAQKNALILKLKEELALLLTTSQAIAFAV